MAWYWLILIGAGGILVLEIAVIVAIVVATMAAYEGVGSE